MTTKRVRTVFRVSIDDDGTARVALEHDMPTERGEPDDDRCAAVSLVRRAPLGGTRPRWFPRADALDDGELGLEELVAALAAGGHQDAQVFALELSALLDRLMAAPDLPRPKGAQAELALAKTSSPPAPHAVVSSIDRPGLSQAARSALVELADTDHGVAFVDADNTPAAAPFRSLARLGYAIERTDGDGAARFFVTVEGRERVALVEREAAS